MIDSHSAASVRQLHSGEATMARDEDKIAPTYVLSGIADLTVHVNGTDRDEAKIAYAEMVARAAGAHVTAFFANNIPLTPIPPGPGSEWIVSELWKNGQANGEEAGRRLRERLARIDASHEIRRYDNLIGELETVTRHIARTSDAFVFGRPYGEERHWPEFLEAVLFDAGGTALVVPPGLVSPSQPRKVLVAWKDTSQCAHAVSSALPFLKAADEVYLVSVSEGASDEERHVEPAADMATHLARHGVKVEVRHLPKWDEPGMGILNEASSVGANLIVAGAYGRSRVREWIWGGVTRDLLTSSHVPLLLRH